MDQGDRNINISNCKYQKEKDPSLLIKKIVIILEHQVTRNDIERQKAKLNEYLEISSNGFMVRDLLNVIRIIELLLEKIHIQEYTTLLEKILLICSFPPVLAKASDVLTFTSDLQEYFTMLGYLLVALKNESLRDLVAFALIDLFSSDLSDQRCYLSLDGRKKSAKKSQLPKILGHLLALADENLYIKILQVINCLTKEVDEMCKMLIDRDALNSLCTRLEPTWKERYPDTRPSSTPIDNITHYDDASKIICSLLEYLKNKKDNMKHVKNISLFSLWSIQYVYRLYVTSTVRALYRNNIIVIIIKLIELFPNMDLVKSGLAEDLMSVSMSPLYMKNSWAAHVRLTLSDDDYVYVQLMISTIPHYINFIGGIRLLEELRVIHRLLKISMNTHTITWPQPQVCVISVATMDVLKKIVPHMEEEFIENAGPLMMLNILQKYQVNDSDITILKKCLETLNHILNNNPSNMILNSILFNDGLNVILNLCGNILLEKLNHIVKEKSVGIALCVLNTLYKHSRPKDNTPIVNIIIKYLKQIVDPSPSIPLHDNRVIICVINFIWEHIVKFEEDSREFVKLGGAFLLLDIIQIYPFVVQLVALSALVDLCEYGYCIPYLITWRGNGQKIIPLLMKLFREENKSLSVKTGPCGQILDVKYPLMGKDQWIQTFCRCKEWSGNPSSSDLFVSSRPKIYALLQMLNVRYAETVEIADEHYKSYNDDLSAKDKVSLLLAENFLALKLGESWVELKTEIDMIQITPTTVDEKMMLNIIDRYLRWNSYLQKKQNMILRDDYHKDLIEEQKLYNYLEESRLSDALQALNELKYIARCSERMFRISQKFLRNSLIEKSVLSSPIEPHPQKTYFSKICVTPVFDETINIESKIGRNTEETVIIPVSPTVSNEACEIDTPEDLLSPSDINYDFRE